MLNRKLQTHGDFVALSDILFDRTRERVSPTTLRRLWGYCNEGVKPRRFTPMCSRDSSSSAISTISVPMPATRRCRAASVSEER